MEQIVETIQKNGITTVRFEVSDIFGIPHGRCLAARHFEELSRSGLNYSMGFMNIDPNGGIATGTGYGEEIHWKDCKIFPDLTTFQILPWRINTARVMAEGEFEGEKVPAYPRSVARKQLDRLKDFGLSLWSAHEYEFYVVKQDTMEAVRPKAVVGAILPLCEYEPFFQQILTDFPKVGVDIENYVLEGGVGQLEITYRPEFGIKAADNAHTFRLGVKEIALKHGLLATFMSKPWWDHYGSSSHYCHSLWDLDGKVGKLYDANSPTGLSKVGEHWMAGLVSHARAITILMAPTTNCLKRFQKNSFAPTNVTWGPDNRTCAFRTKINGERGTYIENRIGAAGGNPYIGMAATIAAGLDGIINELPLPEGLDGAKNAYVEDDCPPGTQLLPTDMEEAIEALLGDDVITTALGPEFIKCFVGMKRHEMKLANDAASKGKAEEWEREFLFYIN